MLKLDVFQLVMVVNQGLVVRHYFYVLIDC